MVQPAISNAPVTPRIDPAVNDNMLQSSVEEGTTSKKLWLNIAELREHAKKFHEMFSTACTWDLDPTSEKLKRTMEKLDSTLDRVDDEARRLWQSEVDSCLKDLEAVVHDGKKFIGLHRNNSHQDDSRARRYCWYHSRFGVDAANCQPPCGFDKEYNTEVLDDIRDNGDDPSLAAWLSEVEFFAEELAQLINDGVKFIGPYGSALRHGDSRTRQYCWYHSRFDVDAANCQPPCDFDYENFFSEWCERVVQDLRQLSDDLQQISLHRSCGQSPSRSHHQSRNRSRSRSYSMSRDQSGNRSYSRSRNQSRNRSHNRSRNQSRNRSYIRSPNRPRNQSGGGSYYRSRNRSRDGSYNRSGNQCRNRSYNRSPNHPRNQSNSGSYCTSRNRSRDGSYNRSHFQSPQWSHSRVSTGLRTPSWDRSYGPTRSPPSLSSSEVICWYHREFGESAKRCHSPCDFYDYYSTD